jgi:hypothetical protein
MARVLISKGMFSALSKKQWLQLLPFYTFFLILFLLTCRLPFFWDKDILYSKTAFWLLDHHFSMAIPNELDPGYPPALAYLLALCWKITGKSLFTAHLLMLPFTLGIVWQSRKLAEHFLGASFVVPAMMIIFTDTTLLSQTVVFSTDLVMLFFMLLALNAVLFRNRMLLAAAVTGLVFSHMRGLMVAAFLGTYDIYLTFFTAPAAAGNAQRLRNRIILLIRTVMPYTPAMVLFTVWIYWHHHYAGWSFVHSASPWAGCFEKVDGRGMIRNVLILMWRMVDYGKLFLWIMPALALLMSERKKLITDPVIRSLLFLLISSFLFSAPSMIIFKILNGQRYLIPFYYVLALLTTYLLFINPGTKRIRNVLFVIILAGLFSGNFWVYPGKIANGWDATLAHLPYHHLRKKMIAYIEDQNIPFNQVGSGTPNTAAIMFIEANNDERAFPGANLKTQQYVFYSNLFNMFTDEEIDELNHHWQVVKEYRCMQVYVRLYRKA